MGLEGLVISESVLFTPIIPHFLSIDKIIKAKIKGLLFKPIRNGSQLKLTNLLNLTGCQLG